MLSLAEAYSSGVNTEESSRYSVAHAELFSSKASESPPQPTYFDKTICSSGVANLFSSVLTPEEYASARESTLTAFYTSPEVITAIYKAMEQMGFKEGNLLEPSCGIGNFIGMLPEAMKNSKIYGVELDTISAGIAQQLYRKQPLRQRDLKKPICRTASLMELSEMYLLEILRYQIKGTTSISS